MNCYNPLIIKQLSWLERLIVVQEVVGSKPIFHPTLKTPQECGVFLFNP
jgi:hypothetical protein